MLASTDRADGRATFLERSGAPRVVLLALALTTAFGCASTTEDVSDESEGALRRGDVTLDEPQVGVLLVRDSAETASRCTATLVGPHSVLTAAHCVDFGSASIGAASGTFSVSRDASTAPEAHAIDGYVSYGSRVGSSDLALVHLRDPITDLLPLPLARTQPSNGEQVSLYGYGVNDCKVGRGGGDFDGQKRLFTFAWDDQPHAVCDGDSGGPLIVGGNIVQVVSYAMNLVVVEREGFGHVWEHHDALAVQIESWN